ncbi:WYL domain-containing protein [Propioniciclava sp.]|uniref:helix-turn-helix transcriptional regulator n=1 Tax=Propioniciclava sp. TaxID=2038686 RepID=UPI002621DE85|nr:WYL domain-containing protein [Propioniciclava sp.]
MPDTTARVLRLLSLLEARAQWSGTELADRLGVTTRTIRRDIERLRSLGYPVAGEHGAEGGYRLGRGLRLPPLLLADDEAVAVAVALRVAAGSHVTGAGEAAVRALGKLDQVLPAALRDHVRALGQVIDVRRPTGDVDADALVTLATAVRDHTRVRFAYGDPPSERDVEPTGVVTTGRRWYLHAFDPDRDDWRTFRIDRMDAVTATTWRFRPRPGPDPADDVRRAVAHAWRGTPYTVVYDAPPDAVAAAGWWGPEVRLTALPGGRTEVRGEEDRLETLAWYLTRAGLALDCALTVVEPDALRDAFIRLGNRVAGFGGAVSAGT